MRRIFGFSFILLLGCSGGSKTSPDSGPISYDAGSPISVSECDASTGGKIPCGFISVTWDIEEETLSCSEVSAKDVQIEVTPAGKSALTFTRACEAGSALTPELVAGPYSVRLHLVDQDTNLLASTPGTTIVVEADGELTKHHATFRVSNTAGRERYRDACREVGSAYCARQEQCGEGCSVSNFSYSCCEDEGTCDAVSAITAAQVSSCKETLNSLSCGYFDFELYQSATDLSFCEQPPPTPPTAANLGVSCNQEVGCPKGYQCITYFEDAENGSCTISCDGSDDTTTCSNGYRGPGAPTCVPGPGGTFVCLLLCGEYNNGDPTCPGQMTCEDPGRCVIY